MSLANVHIRFYLIIYQTIVIIARYQPISAHKIRFYTKGELCTKPAVVNVVYILSTEISQTNKNRQSQHSLH